MADHNNKPLCGRGGTHYTDAQRREAVAQYVVLGNIARVSDATGIPDTTLRDWKNADWWHSLDVAIREEKKSELDAQLSTAISKGVAHLTKGLEEGDERLFNIGGQIVREKQAVSARDAATISGILFDKRQILRNQATSITSSAGADRLNKLAAEFEKFSAAKQIEGEVEPSD